RATTPSTRCGPGLTGAARGSACDIVMGRALQGARTSPYGPAICDPSRAGAMHARPVCLPHHPALAAHASRPAAALLAAHAQRGESIDHAGGDRTALRASPGGLRQGRPEDARV